MSRNTRYSPELRERAVRMAIEKREGYPSEWASFSGVAKLFGFHERRSGPGFEGPRSIKALVPVSPATNASASRCSNARCAICAERTRS
jgi:hypothetical protein